MNCTALLVPASDTLVLREENRRELGCQVVHDSLHRRAGWVWSYLLKVDDAVAGFGGVAVAGPWAGKPTVFEFHVAPAWRARAFELFEALLAASGAKFLEVQTNDALLNVMLHTYGRDLASEKIVFADRFSTALPAQGAVLTCVTPEAEIVAAREARQGGGEWTLTLEGVEIGRGGLLFHYNVPYADIYMKIVEAQRRRGFGAYLVQELKRCAYELGAIPAARCSPDNVGSRRTLQKAGLVPYAHIVVGTVAMGVAGL